MISIAHRTGEGPSSLSWAPGLAAHVLTPDEVALLSESGSHALRGRVYAVVTPLIDGRRTADDVVTAIDGDISAASVHYALLRLQDSGYLVSGGGRQAAGPTARVEVIGLPEDAGEQLHSRLSDAVGRLGGLGGPLTVGLTDDYLRPEVHTLATSCLAAASSFLPIRPVGRLIWVGPLLRPGSESLWRLFLARVRLNRPADVQALERGAAFPLVPTDTSPGMFDLGLALGTALLVSELGGDNPAGIDESLLTLDCESLELTRHPIAHVVETASPPPSLAFDQALMPVVLRPAGMGLTSDGGHRVTRPEDTLERLGQVVSSITGVVSPPQRVARGTTLPVYTSQFASHLPSPVPGRALRQLQGAAGKGVSDAQARASCTAEAVERYSCAVFADSPRRRARLEEIADSAVDPRDLLLFSEAQYAGRAEGNGAQQGFNHIPAPFDPSRPIEWTPLVSLVSGRTRWVPSAHCFFGYRDSEDTGEPFQLADSNGCAAGNTFEEAVLQGILELLERDAVAAWWYSRAVRPQVDLSSFGDPTFSQIAESYDKRGRVLHVLDLTVDTGVPVVAAIRWRLEDGGGIDLGFGAHLDRRIAVSRALSELEQSAFDVVDTGGNTSPDVAAWRATATVENQPYVLPSTAIVTANELPHRGGFADLRDEVDWCVRMLERRGHDVLVYDHTRPDVGFPVVRVVAPGLRHFWKRLAPGRLYDVPVELGWVPRRLTEHELNPIGMFL